MHAFVFVLPYPIAVIDFITQGIAPGMLKNSWCQGCHSKMTVAVECAQFRQLQPSDIDGKTTRIQSFLNIS